MTAINNGGRVNFDANAEYRLLLADGTISAEIYIVDTERSDRKGHVFIKEKNTSKQYKVQHRRILPVNVEGKSAVIESAGKYRSICPKCNYIELILPNSDQLTCPIHGKFELYWLGVRPMSQEVSTQHEKREKRPNPDKKAKPVSENKSKSIVTVDVAAIASIEYCELWYKNVSFDHEKFDVKSYVLLYVNQTPRKFCFNTYNGNLGKKSGPLPIAEFTQNVLPPDSKQKPWYIIQDLDKMRDKLTKDGYIKHTQGG